MEDGDSEQLTLDNLRKRFTKNVIYVCFFHFQFAMQCIFIDFSLFSNQTLTGKLLLAVNPFKSVANYDTETVQRYQKNNSKDLAPHIFATANDTFLDLFRTKTSQCIVVSGEYGSGKTITTNHITEFLCANNEKMMKKASNTALILEAFGNCQTPLNSNSSRYVKLVEVFSLDCI